MIEDSESPDEVKDDGVCVLIPSLATGLLYFRD